MDLIFSVLHKSKLPEANAKGELMTDFLSDKYEGVVCFKGENTSQVLKKISDDLYPFYLLIIDPFRIESSIKKHKEDDMEIYHIQATVSIDALIDKILLDQKSTDENIIKIRQFD